MTQRQAEKTEVTIWQFPLGPKTTAQVVFSGPPTVRAICSLKRMVDITEDALFGDDPTPGAYLGLFIED